MKLKKLLAVVVFGALVMLASCSSKFNTLSDIKKSGELIVGTNAEFAPFEFKDGENFVGIDMDIIFAYGKEIGVEVVIKDQDFDAALTAVANKKVDVVIAGLTKNEKREKTMSFTDAYYSASQVVIVKNDSAYAELTSQADILAALTANKAKIGVQGGTTGEYYVKGDEDWGFAGISETTYQSFDNGALATLALSNGQIDAVVIDSAPALSYAKKYSNVKVLPVTLTEEEYAIAVAKGNTSLVESLNDFIAKIKGDGTFEAILEKYNG